MMMMMMMMNNADLWFYEQKNTDVSQNNLKSKPVAYHLAQE